MEKNSETILANQKISRRNFLKAALGSAIIASGIVGNPSTGNNARKEEGPELSEEKFESKFNVQLMTLNEHLIDVGEETLSEASVVELKWNSQRVRLLEQVFNVLPESFYELSPSGEKLRITLSDFRGTCCGQFETFGYNHHVALASPLFDPNNPRRALTHAAHEFTHLKEPKAAILPERRDEIRGLSPEIIEWSRWWDKIDEILGGKFYEMSYEIYLKLDGKKQVLLSKLGVVNSKELQDGIDSESKEKLFFYERLSYGLLGLKYPAEFIAVMSEYYMGGKKSFIERYEEFFSQGVSLNLYRFMKEEVFRGKEYDKFPVIR